MVVLCTVLAGVVIARRPALSAAGWALVSSDPVESADAIVVTIDAGPAGILEAADLVHNGVSQRVAVFDDPADPATLEFLRRGVAYEDRAAREIRQLQTLGIANVERIHAVGGTEDEGSVLPGWCELQELHSVVVVGNSDHTRRLRRVFHRSMKGRQTRVFVRAARFSAFDPDEWWHTRAGIRTEIVELQKLLLDLARHPIS